MKKCQIGGQVYSFPYRKFILPKSFSVEDLNTIAQPAKEVGNWLAQYPKIIHQIKLELTNRVRFNNHEIPDFGLYANTIRVLYYTSNPPTINVLTDSVVEHGNLMQFIQFFVQNDLRTQPDCRVSIDFLLSQSPESIAAYFSNLSVEECVQYIRYSTSSQKFYAGALNDVIISCPAVVLKEAVAVTRNPDGPTIAHSAPCGLINLAIEKRSTKYLASALGERVAYGWDCLGYRPDFNAVFDRIHHRRSYDPLKQLAYSDYDSRAGARITRELYRRGVCNFQQTYYATRPHHAQTAWYAIAIAANRHDSMERVRVERISILVDIIEMEHAIAAAHRNALNWPHDPIACSVVMRSLVQAGRDCANQATNEIVARKHAEPERYSDGSADFLRFLKMEALPNFDRLCELYSGHPPKEKSALLEPHNRLIEWYTKWNPEWTERWPNDKYH